MPHVSKRELDEAIKKKLFDQLFTTFKEARSYNVGFVIKELLTPTEKMMLAKRLAVVLLLDKGLPQHTIAEHLKVSTSTVIRTSLDIENGRYDKVIKISGGKKEHLLEVIIKLILYSMPPRVGRGRWKLIDHLLS